MHSVSVVELHVTVNYTKIVCVAQQCSYDKLYRRQQYNLRRFSCECPMLKCNKRTSIVSFNRPWSTNY